MSFSSSMKSVANNFSKKLSAIKTNLHEKVHSVKSNKASKTDSEGSQSNLGDVGKSTPRTEKASYDLDDDDTSSVASSPSSSGRGVEISGESLFFTSSAMFLDFSIIGAVDLRISPVYFKVGFGQQGEAFNKKSLILKSSGILNSKNPPLFEDPQAFIFEIPKNTDLNNKEISVKVMSSQILKKDKLIGECNFKLMPSILNDERHIIESRLLSGIGGLSAGLGSLTCSYKLYSSMEELTISRSTTKDHSHIAVITATSRAALLDSSTAASNLFLVEALRRDDANTVSELLMRLPLLTLFDVIDREEKNEDSGLRSALEAAMTKQDLSVVSRSRVLKALHIRLASASTLNPFENLNDENSIDRLFCSCPDRDFAEMKRLLDEGSCGDFKLNLCNLVFTVISSDVVRQSILTRLGKYANICKFENRESIHIISDIDYTCYTPSSPFSSSPTVNAANGLDRKWPTQTMVPGSLLLSKALKCRTTFVSSKPFAMEAFARKALRSINVGSATVLSGSAPNDLLALTGGIAKYKNKLAGTQYATWSLYRRLYPESQFIWIGQSPQFARSLIADSNGVGSAARDDVGKVVLVLLHNNSSSSASNNEDFKHALQEGVYLFDSYVGAALACFDRKLLKSVEELDSIMFETRFETTRVLGKWLKKNSSSVEIQLAKDREEDLKKECMFAQHRINREKISTPYKESKRIVEDSEPTTAGIDNKNSWTPTLVSPMTTTFPVVYTIENDDEEDIGSIENITFMRGVSNNDNNPFGP